MDRYHERDRMNELSNDARLTWRRSTKCDSGLCVEVAATPDAATLLSPFAPIRCGSPRLTCAGSGVRHDGPSDAQLASYLRALSGGLREDQRHVCGQRQRAGSSVTERATTTPVPAPRQARAPASVPAPRERVAFAGLRPAGERLRVLLVEDDPADAFLVEEQLLEARAPLDIETVATMAQARQRLV